MYDVKLDGEVACQFKHEPNFLPAFYQTVATVKEGFFKGTELMTNPVGGLGFVLVVGEDSEAYKLLPKNKRGDVDRQFEVDLKDITDIVLTALTDKLKAGTLEVKEMKTKEQLDAEKN